MRDDPVVVDLVLRARAGDSSAWDAIVERYAPLVWGVCGRYGVTGSDADDVAGGVWLRLVERLDTLHEPAALPGWLVRVTQRECLQSLRARRRQLPVDAPEPAARGSGEDGVDGEILVAERRHALRAAFAELPARCRELLSMLFAEPPASYAEISAALGVPVGAIGPSRGRCLDRLRRSRALAALQLA
ncbi:RNA polymerase sigma factor [Microbispora sp. H11081]|uniref:RNA polymerase sigma factor n=1 Tax=Microbispora sp. H11081 TaxID=2729107 RepID=UPI0014745C03|nr:sigma-70 family RNA polymerase sigma factor [Microbispora sp. H11081]